jgi:hypothetical protein
MAEEKKTDAESAQTPPEEKKTEAEKPKKGGNKVKNVRLAGQSVSGRFDKEIVFDKDGIAEVSAEERKRLVSIPGFEEA